MATLTRSVHPHSRLVTDLVRALIVTLALATAAIHLVLGGLLFTLNAVGYAGLAILMVLPGPIGRVRVLVRLATIAFTATTIAGWLLFGVRFSLAYLDKTIELALIAAVSLELWRVDGGPLVIARRARRVVGDVLGGAR
ncbi:MAG TPA: hypothetical protein VFY18_00155 [Candidatus Limnocylindrales bacterium]|nr:hypothetical protein [Candidatus Limnocylindrales bacterium]